VAQARKRIGFVSALCVLVSQLACSPWCA